MGSYTIRASGINGDRTQKETSMSFRTLGDAVANPVGTARLLQAHSTLRRARTAGLTYDQICTVFPDAAKYTPAQLDAFAQIGEDLVSGRTRFSGRLIDPSNGGAPKPA
jgi:hypothetical protein